MLEEESEQTVKAHLPREELQRRVNDDPRDIGSLLDWLDFLIRNFNHRAAVDHLIRGIEAHGSPEAFRRALGKQCLLVFSNCQGKPLVDALRSVPAFENDVFTIGLYNVSIAELPPALQKIGDILLFQTTTRNAAGEELLLKLTVPDRKLIRFPAVINSSMWPFYYQAPSSTDAAGRPIYRYAYADRYIDRAARDGLDPASIRDRYLELDVPATTELDRLVEKEAASERAKEANCHVRLREFIETEAQHRAMFHTPNHPVQAVIQHAAKQVLTELRLPFDEATIPRAEYPVTSGVQHPVHPKVVKHLKLPGFPPGYLFRMARGAPCTFEDFIGRYLERSI